MIQLQFIGNLGADVQLRMLANGKELMTFNVAVSTKTGTLWVSVATNKIEGVLQYLTKGRQVYIQGRPEFKTYNGNIDISVYADHIELVGRGNDDKPAEAQGKTF